MNFLQKFNGFRLLVAYITMFEFSIGLIGVYFQVFVKDKVGSFEVFSQAMAAMIISSAIFAFYAGKWSDKIGKKIPLVVTTYTLSICVYLYTVIDNFFGFLLLQVVFGACTSIQSVMLSAIASDLTSKETRGAEFGTLHLWVGVFNGIAVLIGGKFIDLYGIEYMFIFVAILLVLVGTVITQLRTS